MKCSTLATIILVPLAVVMYTMYQDLGFAHELTHIDNSQCTLLGGQPGGIKGSEDMAHLGGGVVLLSSGDLYRVFDGEPTAPGRMFAVDMKSKEVMEVPLQGMPAELAFQPHGMYYSNATNHVFTVTHGLKKGGGTQIFIFDLERGGPGLSGLSLRFIRAVSSPIWGNGVLNDVVEGVSAEELYVTQWLQVPIPDKGFNHPREDEKYNKLKGGLLNTYPGAVVYRCTFSLENPSAAASCVVAVTGLKAPNGITKEIGVTNPHIFVSDIGAKAIVIMQRGEDGTLTQHGSIHTTYPIDNIDFVEGELMGGSAPHVYKCIQAMVFHDHTVRVPGGLTTMTPDNAVPGGYRVEEDNAMHDGTMLSHISAGFRWGGSVLLGSPASPGVLLCEL